MRNPEKLVEGDIFIHKPTQRIVRAEFYDPKTEHVTLSDGAIVSAHDLIDIEEPGYMRAVLAEIAMLRRELRAATSSNVTINGSQFMCSQHLAERVEEVIRDHARADSNVRSLQHRVNGYARDIDKSNAMCAMHLERIGLLRGTISGALFAIKSELYQGAQAALEAGTKI